MVADDISGMDDNVIERSWVVIMNEESVDEMWESFYICIGIDT